MTYFYVIGIPLLVVGGFLLIGAFAPNDELGDFFIGCFCVAGILAVIWGLALAIYYPARAADRSRCRGFAHKTGRATKFAQYNAVTWDCLTRAHDGKWIPVDQIGDYNK